MSIDFLLAGDTTLFAWQPDSALPNYLPQPFPSVLIDEYNDGIAKQAYLYTTDTATPLPDWPVGTYIVGAWDREQIDVQGYLQLGQTFDGTTVLGTPTYAVQSDYWVYLRPLGNDSIGGEATGLLDSHRWQGAPEGKFLNDALRYDDFDAPFTLEFTRVAVGIGALPWDNVTQYFTGDFVTNIGSTWVASQDSLNESPFGGSAFWDLVSAPGWGWKAEMLSPDPLRDITARAIAIYSDPAWTAFLYTTGAFVLDGTTGLYTAVCPPGNRTATPDPVYYSLLWGSIQEGNWQHIDPANGSIEDRLHWAVDQGAAGFAAIVDAAGPTPRVTDANPSAVLYSPDGHIVIGADAVSSARLALALAAGAQDTLNPTLTIHFPDGTDVIPMTWNNPNLYYRSTVIPGIEAKIAQYGGYKLRVELTWA